MSWISVEKSHPINGQKVKIKTFDLNDKPVVIESTFRIYDIDENNEAWSWDIGKRQDIIARPTHWQPIED